MKEYHKNLNIKDKYKTYKNVDIVSDGPYTAYWCGSHGEIRVKKRGKIGIYAVYKLRKGYKQFDMTCSLKGTKSAIKIAKIVEKALKKMIKRKSKR